MFQLLIGLKNRKYFLAFFFSLFEVLTKDLNLILSFDEALFISGKPFSVILQLLTVLPKKFNFFILLFLSLEILKISFGYN